MRMSPRAASIAGMEDTDTQVPTAGTTGGASTRVAAVDIGTVTTRLLVADTDGTDVREVVRRTVVTHLGEGLHATGALSAAGIARVASAVASFADEIAGLDVDDVVAVATSAARDASNGREFLGAVAEAGVRPRIIPGPVEARLSFAGATCGIEGRGVLIADLGGGSTELVLGSASTVEGGREVRIRAARSLDVGSRRVLDMFLASDPPRADELDAAAAWVARQMEPFFAQLPERPQELITLAGTGTTLAAVKQRLVPYDPARVHGSHLSGADVADLLAELAAMDLASRRAVVGMDPQRADVIVAGALILQTIIALSGLDGTTVSEHDILYGLVLAGSKGID
jgi:exopolyphosphatase / guanosine-5'-triphosphate,3'-diphosphate pyrophosphatase